MAILSQPYQGRGACVHCGFCERFGCEMRRQIQHAGHRDSDGAKRPATAKSAPTPTCAKSRPMRTAASPAPSISTKARQGDLPESQGRCGVRERRRDAAAAADVEIQPLPAWPGEFQRLGGQVLSCSIRGPSRWRLFEHPLNEYKSIEVTRVIHDYYAARPASADSMAAAGSMRASTPIP